MINNIQITLKDFYDIKTNKTYWSLSWKKKIGKDFYGDYILFPIDMEIEKILESVGLLTDQCELTEENLK